MVRVGTEEELHVQIVEYLKLQYPTILFRTDMGGIRLTPGLRAKAKRMQGGRAWPDLFIAETKGSADDRHIWCAGLFIELKKAGTKLYLKDGRTMVANEHYQEQSRILQQLRIRGYRAVFAVGFDEAKQIIDEYLKG